MNKADIVQRVAAKAIIVKDGKILLLREATTYGEGTQHGRYQVPGGRVETGEQFEEALKREVREETGLNIEVGHPLFVGEWRPVIRGVQNQIIGIFFVCSPTSDEVILSSEHDDYQWIDPHMWQQYDVMDPEDKAIQRFLETTSPN